MIYHLCYVTKTNSSLFLSCETHNLSIIFIFFCRLLYQSRKRGMLENGLLFSTFADKHLEKLNGELLNQYDKLINEPSNDWDIYYWLTGKEEPPAQFKNEIFEMLKTHTQNKSHEQRYRQPDIHFSWTRVTTIIMKKLVINYVVFAECCIWCLFLCVEYFIRTLKVIHFKIFNRTIYFKIINYLVYSKKNSIWTTISKYLHLRISLKIFIFKIIQER